MPIINNESIAKMVIDLRNREVLFQILAISYFDKLSIISALQLELPEFQSFGSPNVRISIK